MNLQERFKRSFERHIKERNGIISAPDVLIGTLLLDVQRWLQTEAFSWEEGGGDAEASAIRELRHSVLG